MRSTRTRSGFVFAIALQRRREDFGGREVPPPSAGRQRLSSRASRWQQPDWRIRSTRARTAPSNAIAAQADGKVVGGRRLQQPWVGQARNRIARLNTDGTLDTGFDPNADADRQFCIAVQPDGDILDWRRIHPD